MTVKSVLKSIESSMPVEDEKLISKETKIFLNLLKEQIAKQKVSVIPFIGGSFAKGTMAKKDIYDVDIFMRFDWKNEYISDILEKLLKPVAKKLDYDLVKIHGSRDYFRVMTGTMKYVFEVIPVTSIKKPREARNVTDLSYFHVKYVKNKVRGTKIGREIALAKLFCIANNVYGAETYISGLSGYAIECLVIHYKSFEKMLKELVKVKLGKRLVLDPEKLYKKKDDIFFDMNESRLHSPVILVDPTWKERNVLAALKQGTFEKFQKAARDFLKKPNKIYFVLRDSKEKASELMDLAEKKKAEYLRIRLFTDRQDGDIAATKMKKFSDFLAKQLGKYFEIIGREFGYRGDQTADAYFVFKSKKEVVRIGPPVELKKHAAKFKKANKKTFVKNGLIHSKIKVDFTAKEFVTKFVVENEGKMKEMAITQLAIVF